jgi:hypothetical protein
MKKLKKLLAILAPMTIAIGGISCSLVVSACKSDKDPQTIQSISATVYGNYKKYIPTNVDNYISVVGNNVNVNNQSCVVTAVDGLT